MAILCMHTYEYTLRVCALERETMIFITKMHILVCLDL